MPQAGPAVRPAPLSHITIQRVTLNLCLLDPQCLVMNHVLLHRVEYDWPLDDKRP